ncbi:hypothetical protein WN51_02873 [Melipona quadrifasciata]|uniref:Uncharacterized protein n=1 Tax=Melipona quadrifasciata TaxID=166423 RepID=A0A0M9A8W3_9HYME|nr:hypothetical protein WN51_02873 [Melipona quadrifasciata]
MANQSTKKELLEEALHYHPDGGEEEVDKEWEEFSRLMAKLRENRQNRPHRYFILRDVKHANFMSDVESGVHVCNSQQSCEILIKSKVLNAI